MFEKSHFDRELRKLDHFATAGYVVGLHIRFTSPLIVFQTYAQEWADHYTKHGYALRDPAIAWAFSQTGWTRWSNPEIHDPFGIFEEARRYDLNFGVTISVGPIQSRTVASLARDDREFTDEEIEQVRSIVEELHLMSEPPESLTDAQAAALRCIAAGDRHDAAAAKLGISVSALKARLNSARQRLMARTTAEAIQRAKDYGLL